MLLVAVVVEHPAAVLAAGARAVMVAGLSMVDYVLTAENEAALEAVVAALAPDILVRCEASQRERLRQLIDYVHRRHSGTR
jgi:bifunctional ADP-heptose synthase (sugar kinase/adenylyltransferase)